MKRIVDGVVVEIPQENESEFVVSPPIPTSITPRQGEIILSRMNLLATAKSAIDALADEEAKIDYSRAQEWRRDWPLLNALSSSLGLTQAQVDAMFIEASKL